MKIHSPNLDEFTDEYMQEFNRFTASVVKFADDAERRIRILENENKDLKARLDVLEKTEIT